MLTPANTRILRQYGNKLMQLNVGLQVMKDRRFQIISLHPHANKKPSAVIEACHVLEWQRSDLLDEQGKDQLVLSLQGRAWLRRHLADVEPFAAQHQLRVNAKIRDAPLARRNVSTSPLAWLRARGKCEVLGIGDIEFESGEQLCKDFLVGQNSAKLTMDWRRPVFIDGSRKADGLEEAANVLDARRRLDEALDYLGPGLDDLMLAVCCYEQGLEACESHFALPRRSAKAILKLGLIRLSVFYGFQSAKAAAASFRMR
ncbi:DUF6456 domain-containing protein [Alphaproteobacteria bacterium]|nr:DUF6456 domain-containing protein [Alphaproteobacteria bacterium]